MISKKAKTTKKKAATKTTPKVEATKEEVVEKQSSITGYVVPLFLLREPMNKNIPVADVFYKKNSDAITLQCHAPNQEAAIEQVIQGDISIQTGGNISMVSNSEAPEAWIKNLHKSREFSGSPFIAGEAQALYETE
tara:strand:- start:418 stop:825 length:408 start_codon:yes stop_codon:yes gene_type:complete